MMATSLRALLVPSTSPCSSHALTVKSAFPGYSHRKNRADFFKFGRVNVGKKAQSATVDA